MQNPGSLDYAPLVSRYMSRTAHVGKQDFLDSKHDVSFIRLVNRPKCLQWYRRQPFR